MIKINLLPVRASAKREVFIVQATIVAIALLIVLAVLGFMDYSISGKIKGVNTAIARTEAEINRLSAIIKKVNKFKSESQKLKKKLSIIKTLDAGREAPVRMIDELTKMVPDKLWLKSFKESGWKIVMVGNALDHKNIADFMANMERSPMFTGVQLKSTRKEKGAGLEVTRFTIEATFKPPKPKKS